MFLLNYKRILRHLLECIELSFIFYRYLVYHSFDGSPDKLSLIGRHQFIIHSLHLFNFVSLSPIFFGIPSLAVYFVQIPAYPT